MRKRKPSYEGERRIYVLVAEKIRTTDMGVVLQPPGRQIAQAAHVVSRRRYEQCYQDPDTPWYPITTIILQARDSNELEHAEFLLLDNKIKVTEFWDSNMEAYGGGQYLTAICTEPIFKEQGAGSIDYLPLWGTP